MSAGVEAPIDPLRATVPARARARATAMTIERAAVVGAVIPAQPAVSVLEAGALLIASAQSRAAQTAVIRVAIGAGTDTLARIMVMNVVAMTIMITTAPCLGMMGPPWRRGGAGTEGITSWRKAGWEM
jgi:hypothetical protein